MNYENEKVYRNVGSNGNDQVQEEPSQSCSVLLMKKTTI